ncbi:MAG: lysophospholipid acyltransferase family protein [Oligoflexia bacterium]|nr:lysophospholipid acyltransferase family protein [Oligoflexia bacterium]
MEQTPAIGRTSEFRAPLWRRARVSILVFLGRMALRGLSSTWRWSIPEHMLAPDFLRAERPRIFVFWHGRQLMMPALFERCGGPTRGARIATLISRHSDGRIIAGIIRGFGLESISGSSSNGAVEGGRRLLEFLQGGGNVALTPDGPRGPAQRLKQGAIRIAQLSGAPIVALAASASWHWRFGSWDRMMLPLPFARIRVSHVGPLVVPDELDAAALDEFTHKLELMLNEVTEQVDCV